MSRARAALRRLPRGLGLHLPVLVSLALMVAATAVPTRDATAADAPPVVPPQGVYDQCAPTPDLARCVEHLQRAAAGGMPIVLNYTAWYATPADLMAYADAAAAAGVQLIWPMNDPVWRGRGNLHKRYPKIGSACTCNDVLEWVVTRLKDHPATWGWYVGDELPAEQAPAVADLVGRIKAVDPVNPTIYVGMGLRGRMGGEIAEFAAHSDWTGTDSYPLGSTLSPSITGDIMAAASGEARAAGDPFVAVLQAYAHGQYPAEGIPSDHFPTRAEMIDQRDQAILRGNPGLILWYALNDVDRSADPAGNWANLVAAANAPAPTAPAPAPAPAPVVPTPRSDAPVSKPAKKARAKVSARAGTRGTRASGARPRRSSRS